jgi:hypothetical protein
MSNNIAKSIFNALSTNTKIKKKSRKNQEKIKKKSRKNQENNEKITTHPYLLLDTKYHSAHMIVLFLP